MTSGWGFPPIDLPAWLRTLTRIDLDDGGEARVAFNVGVVWWSWRVPALLDLAMAAMLGLGMLVGAIAAFNKAE